MTSGKKLIGMAVAAAMGMSLMMGAPVWAHDDEGGEDGSHILLHDLASGIHLDGGVTWFFQGSSGASAGDTGDLSYTFDLELSSQISDEGSAHVMLEGGDGEGVDGNLNSLSTVNYDAFFTQLTNNLDGSTNITVPSISQVFYEGDYMDGRMIASFGKMDIHSMFDDNAYANDETDQFLSAIFTRSADTSYKQLDFYYAPGLALALSPTDLFDVTLIVANGNNDGFSQIVDRPYLVGQLNVKPEFFGRDGNYRFYYLYDARNTTNTTFTKIGSGKSTENTALGISFDQEVADGVGLFARYSQQDDSIVENLVESSWSFGAAIEGRYWGRLDDVLGIGYGSVNVNHDPAVIALAGLTHPDDEIHTEIYYKLAVSDHFSLTPDLQVLQNNGGSADSDTVTVFGVRAQMNF